MVRTMLTAGLLSRPCQTKETMTLLYLYSHFMVEQTRVYQQKIELRPRAYYKNPEFNTKRLYILE